MKLPISIAIPGGRAQSSAGFTLSEIMIAMTVFIFVIGGILSAHIFGLRMFQANHTKLTATEWSRTTFGRIADQVRACNSLMIGSLDSTNGTFEGLLNGEPQQGSGLMVFPSADTNNYLLYFVNISDQTFRMFRRTTNQADSTVILADSVTNSMVFSAEDFAGNVLTSTANSNSPVIHLSLEFYNPELFLQDAHQYKLETSMARHALQ